MLVPSEQRFGSITLVSGALLLIAYAGLFPFVLPIGSTEFDYVTVATSPWWRPLNTVAMVGVVTLLVGLDSVYSKLRASTGIAAWLGLITLKVALVLQACKLAWQILIDPVVASVPAAQFLIRDAVLVTEPAVVGFRLTAASTIIVGIALFGTALYRSGLVPRLAVVLISLGAVGYAAGFLLSVYLAVVGTITLGVGCVLIGRTLWRTA